MLEDIKNYEIYIKRMRKSMKDKLWFVDFLDKDEIMVVDYGCSDGTLLNLLPDNWGKIGYDIDIKMLEKGRKINKNLTLINKWTDVETLIKDTDSTKVLVLSSIIHEIYSYSSLEEIEEFWYRVFNSGFDYVVIRDMIPSINIDREPDINDVRRVYKYGNYEMVDEFNKIWGKIDFSNKNLVHYLLKYRYVENWKKEVRENYFPVYKEDLLNNIIPDTYNVEFIHHYKLPFLKNVIKKDFDIELNDNTHLKLLLTKTKK